MTNGFDKALARADDDGFALPEKKANEKILIRNKIEERTTSAQAYAAAYKEHYSNNNLKEAFNLYRDVITDYPESQEAMYSKKQIENIVAILVPAQEIFDAQVDMALARFKKP